MLNKFNYVFLCIIIFSALALRFLNLENNPPGFYIDEAVTATQTICMSQSGHDFSNHKFPIFSRSSTNGYTSLGMLYLGGLWADLFGYSIGVLRAFVAILSILTILGLLCLAQLFLNKETIFFVLLSAALSPWNFHFSRIFWDPIFFPLFFIWGLYFFFKSGHKKDQLLSAMLFSLALYSYAPARMQIPLMLPILFFINSKKYKITPLTWLYFFLPLVILSIPLIIKNYSGELFDRVRFLSIFSKNYLVTHGGYSFLNALKVFFTNLIIYFSPNFLILKGDPHPRHSINIDRYPRACAGSSGRYAPLQLQTKLT